MSPAIAKTTGTKFVSSSTLDIYEKAAVVTCGPECAQIGSDILQFKNGSAVDAAVATLLCEGVASLHGTGLGGGFRMTIYDAPSGEAVTLDARETAPGLATSTMFGHTENLPLQGGLAVAVPGELLGCWEAHQKYGRLPWKELFDPAIKLCKTGFIITKYLGNYISRHENVIRADPTLSDILVDPKTNQLYQKGDRLKRPKLAKTLRELADAVNPVELFYKGRIAKQLISEIQSFGGIISVEDFSNYKVKWSSPIMAKIGDVTLYSSPPPGSGALLAFMLNVLNDILPAENDEILWQRIVETFKWAAAKRTELADPDLVDMVGLVNDLMSMDYANYVKSMITDNATHNDPIYYGAKFVNNEDNGTCQISILAPDGSAVSVTSSLNTAFGAKIGSQSTGIIFNNGMGDFSAPIPIDVYDLPVSPNNFIEPYKRSFSSMAPTILVDKDGKVVLVIGACGGIKITTTIASTIALYLWQGYDIKEAIDAPRLHHQLFPMKIKSEPNFPQDVLDYLKSIGHINEHVDGIYSAVCAIAVKNDLISANSDFRRQGKTAGF